MCRTRFNEGGARAVADYGRRGGWTVRTPKLVERLVELFEKGLGPRPAYAAVAKHASYGTVHAIYREWKVRKPAVSPATIAPYVPGTRCGGLHLPSERAGERPTALPGHERRERLARATQ